MKLKRIMSAKKVLLLIEKRLRQIAVHSNENKTNQD